MENYTITSKQQALDLTRIPDFRHVKKENVLSLVNMLNNMEPDLAKIITT